MKPCKACGDPTEHVYCQECHDEIHYGIIPQGRARLDSSGAGCPLEPSDEAGPWQDNAIRDMEDNR